jgi:hypothetical protein
VGEARGGAGVVVGGAFVVDTHAPYLRVLQHAHAAKPPACTLPYVGRPADSESAGKTAVSMIALADSEFVSGASWGWELHASGRVTILTQ